jgi:APA family basic amino acid/polyamine antiporter
MSSYQEQAHHAPPSAGGPADNGEPLEAAEQGAAKGALGLFSTISIIVGIVVGAGIYQTAPFIFANFAGTEKASITALVTWGLAGLVSLFGALCYAELATTYPRDGGDIVYLNRAFGDWLGFLFGWVQLTVILTGSIGLMAFVFANYSIRLFKDAFDIELGLYSAFAFAGGAVLALTVTNILGVLYGKVVQNVLTVAKVLGLAAIIASGFMAPFAGAWEQPSLSTEELRKAMDFPFFTPSLGVALVLILYTYGGWNDAAFVAAEVKDGRKNITRGLVAGLLIIALLYVLVNFAYVNALGLQKAQSSKQIAADVLERGAASIDPEYKHYGVTMMCVLVMISALGAVNGLIFTGARVYSTIGKDYRVLSWMGGWSRKGGAPVPALVTQGVLALALIFLVGTSAGRQGINWVLDQTAVTTEEKAVKTADGKTEVATVPAGHFLKPMEWEEPGRARAEGVTESEKASQLAAGGFDTLLACTAPVFWGFFLLTGLSLFALRQRDPHLHRPFRVPLYPVVPLIFCAFSAYLLYSSIDYAVTTRGWKGGLFLLGGLPLLIGLALYGFNRTGGGAAPDGPNSTL